MDSREQDTKEFKAFIGTLPQIAELGQRLGINLSRYIGDGLMDQRRTEQKGMFFFQYLGAGDHSVALRVIDPDTGQSAGVLKFQRDGANAQVNVGGGRLASYTDEDMNAGGSSGLMIPAHDNGIQAEGTAVRWGDMSQLRLQAWRRGVEIRELDPSNLGRIGRVPTVIDGGVITQGANGLDFFAGIAGCLFTATNPFGYDKRVAKASAAAKARLDELYDGDTLVSNYTVTISPTHRKETIINGVQWNVDSQKHLAEYTVEGMRPRRIEQMKTALELEQIQFTQKDGKVVIAGEEYDKLEELHKTFLSQFHLTFNPATSSLNKESAKTVPENFDYGPDVALVIDTHEHSKMAKSAARFLGMHTEETPHYIPKQETWLDLSGDGKLAVSTLEKNHSFTFESTIKLLDENSENVTLQCCDAQKSDEPKHMCYTVHYPDGSQYSVSQANPDEMSQHFKDLVTQYETYRQTSDHVEKKTGSGMER